MKGHIGFLKTTVIGGVIFLIPLIESDPISLDTELA